MICADHALMVHTATYYKKSLQVVKDKELQNFPNWLSIFKIATFKIEMQFLVESYLTLITETKPKGHFF